jgi:hypothetical protein
MAETSHQSEQLHSRMGEPSWLVLRALQLLGGGTRVEVTRQVAALQLALGAGERELDPSTLHYALKRMLAEGLIAEGRRLTEGELSGRVVAEPAAVYRTGRTRPTYVLTALGIQLLQSRQRRIAVEVLMDTAIVKRPKPTIFGIAASTDQDLAERAGNERPEAREWRS